MTALATCCRPSMIRDQVSGLHVDHTELHACTVLAASWAPDSTLQLFESTSTWGMCFISSSFIRFKLPKNFLNNIRVLVLVS